MRDNQKGIQHDLQHSPSSRLSDLLVDGTLHLLELLEEKNTDGIEYIHTKSQVKNIQQIIWAKRADK